MPVTLENPTRQQLLDRFLRYVKIDTRSDEASKSSPSTEKQKDLSRLLADELEELGCDDATMNEWGYVFATVPSNIPENHPAAGKVPTIGLIAHVDTYFGTPGKDVKPQIIEDFDGGDLVNCLAALRSGCGPARHPDSGESRRPLPRGPWRPPPISRKRPRGTSVARDAPAIPATPQHRARPPLQRKYRVRSSVIVQYGVPRRSPYNI